MKTCEQCQTSFDRTDKRMIFCSQECSTEYRTNKLNNQYNQNPKYCKQCNTLMPYKNRHNNFCDKSCSATHTNQNRIRSEWSNESKEKISQKMKKLYVDGKISMPKGMHGPRKIKRFYNCHHCDNIFEQKIWGQKCCSVACRDSIRSANKCAKVRISYFNRNDNTETNLQSSWELTIAKWLDEQNIVWVRPSKRLHWFDTTNQKWRTYLPDFYLPKFDKFIDVKNPMKVKEDADKIKQLTQLFPLFVGNREEVKATVLKW